MEKDERPSARQMAKFATRIEYAWNTSLTVARVLVSVGMGLAIWALLVPQPSGVCICVLALVSGVMSLRSRMHFYDRSAWILILIACTTLEVSSIRRGERENSEKTQAVLDGMTGRDSFLTIAPIPITNNERTFNLIAMSGGKNTIWDVEVDVDQDEDKNPASKSSFKTGFRRPGKTGSYSGNRTSAREALSSTQAPGAMVWNIEG